MRMCWPQPPVKLAPEVFEVAVIPVEPSEPAEMAMLEMASTVKLSGILPDATFEAWVAVRAAVAVALAVAVLVGANVALEFAVRTLP